MLADSHSLIAMKSLECNCHAVTSGLGGFWIGVYFSQAWNKERPSDKTKKLDHTRQDANDCANHQEPGCIWLEYLVNQNWDWSEKHRRKCKNIPKTAQRRAAFLEPPQDGLRGLAQDIGIGERFLQEEESCIERNRNQDKQQGSQWDKHHFIVWAERSNKYIAKPVIKKELCSANEQTRNDCLPQSFTTGDLPPEECSA